MKRWWAVPLLAGVMLTGPVLAQTPAPVEPAQKEAIKALIREVLRDQPELVLEALQTLEAREQAAQEQRTASALATSRDKLERDPGDIVAGNPNGNITVVEFVDHRCGYCKSVAAHVAEVVKADGNVRLVHKQFPILGPQSVQAARAALAAIKQGKGLELHRALMESRGSFDDAMIMDTARKLGIDTARLATDMKAPEVLAQLQRTMELGRSLGIKGTPAFIIGDTLLPGAVDADTLRSVIAEARKKG